MTVYEQFSAKMAGGLLTPSDVLALVSFMRKLVFKLSSKQQDLVFLKDFVQKVDALLQPKRLFNQYPSISSGIRREMSIVHVCLRDPRATPPPTSTDGVQDFLDQIERLPTR
jgi:nucleolar pre-ribosomal-associated protein 1